MSNEESSSRNQGARDDDDADSPSLTASDAHSRRREQIRRAQRSHRERRANYLRALEAEVEELRAKDARNSTEIDHFKVVNRRLCSILRENNIPIPLDLDRSSNENSDNNPRNVGVTQTHQHDEDPMSRAPQMTFESARSADILLDLNDPQIAVDLVMDLEAPCLVSHPHFQGPDGENGHIMQLRNMVIPNSRSDDLVPFTQLPPAVSTRTVSNIELRETLRRLLVASRSLNMAGEMTPVQCWNALRNNPAASRLTRQKFDEVKQALLLGVLCYGFGAIINEELFRDLTVRLLPGS